MTSSVKTPWRQLQIEQLASWDNLPRRLFLVLMALLLLLACGFYVLWPKYIAGQQLQVQTVALQKQYIAAAEQNAWGQIDSNAQYLNERSINRNEVAGWSAQLAHQAHEHGLSSVQIQPVDSNLSVDALPANKDVFSLSVQVEGSYEGVFAYWQELSSLPFVLSMEQIRLVGVGQNRVQAHVNVLFLPVSTP